MFLKSLFKKTIKDNYKFWIVITTVLVLMLILLVFVAQSFVERESNNPMASNMKTGVITQYYTMFAMILPMIYIVITGNKLIAAQVDKGSFAYVMAKPVKRNQVSITQALYLIGSIVTMFLIITITGLIMISITGFDIEIGAFLLLNLGILLFHLAISGISFMASCIFNLSGKSMLVGAGIPVAFFMFNILAACSNLAEVMELFKYLSLNTLYNTDYILAYNANIIWQFLVLFGVALTCYIVGVNYFKKKDLPL